ncbi:helix-turn-helix transcriptional regulator [Agromyces sp. G08B096]|uniref:Helix-turn-helix transcriptional regulator n=1 Tax=Agromyces sp. G08B096 TaxID=3156399 RepID=A0AAU7W7R7_9MICO
MDDDHWRARAGVPRSRGVLAPRPGDPPLTAGGALDAPPADAPVRMARIAAAPGVAELVRHYWIPRWRLAPGTSVTQRVLEYPTANLVIDEHSIAVHGTAVGLGTKRLEGRGWAFGVLLQPGAAGALTGRAPRALVARSEPLRDLPGVDAMRDLVREHVAAGDDADAVAAFERWLVGLGLEVGEDARLVRELVARAEEDRSLMRVDRLAELAGVGVRQLERIVRDELGLTPKWLIRRYRLQEAAARLTAPDRPALGALAAELGYADQAHFTREFQAVIGIPPGRYVREAAAAAASGSGATATATTATATATATTATAGGRR